MIAELEQAIAERDARQGVFRIGRQRAPIQIGRLPIVGRIHQHRAETLGGFGMRRIDRERMGEGAASIGAVDGGVADEAELDRHLGHHWRHRDALLEHFNCLAGTIERVQSR